MKTATTTMMTAQPFEVRQSANGCYNVCRTSDGQAVEHGFTGDTKESMQLTCDWMNSRAATPRCDNWPNDCEWC